MTVHDPRQLPRTTHHARGELAVRVATPRVGAISAPPVGTIGAAVLDGLVREVSALARLQGFAVVVVALAFALLPAAL